MELIILGLKNKKTGAYKVFNVELGHHRQKSLPKHMDVEIGKEYTIKQLAPFPFENFSGISFDYQEEILESWDPCYLRVDAELTQDEFDSMKHNGICYYRFKNRKITILSEFTDIFQYTREMIDYFGEQLGTYDATTWIIHSKITSDKERKAMESIIKEASRDRHGLDITFDLFTAQYLDLFRELSNHGREITFGRYGGDNCSQEDLDTLEMNLDRWMYGLKNISMYHAHWIEHPFFTQAVYDEIRDKHPEDFKQFLQTIVSYDSDKSIPLALSKRLNMDGLFKDLLSVYLNDWRHKVDEFFWDDETDPEHPLAGVHTLEDFFAMDYPLEHVIYDPYEYYCCEDCDGPLPEDWQDDITESDVDKRLGFILSIILPWDKYITNHGREALPFISDERFSEIEAELSNRLPEYFED